MRKVLVNRPPRWRPKPNHPELLHYRSALEISGIAPEGLFLEGTWRDSDGLRPERFCLSIFWCNERVFAWDVDRSQAHRNLKGMGRPLYLQRVVGHHEHTWSDDGYGYVEPLSLDSDEACDVWGLFLVKAGIDPEACVHPNRQAGNLPLGII